MKTQWDVVAIQNKIEVVSRSGATAFHQLPAELWYHLCSFMEVRDFVNLCATCKDMHAAGDDEWIWRIFILRDCPSLRYGTPFITSGNTFVEDDP